MAFKIIEDLEQADELWRAGLLYFQSSRHHILQDDAWNLDGSYAYPDSAPSKYYPEDYVYAIRVEE